MAIYMLTMWFPFTTGGKAAEITSKITKLPSYITKWSRLTTPDGQNGAKVYNLIYIDDNNIPEAGLYISKLASMYYEIEGFCWKVEPVMSVRDGVKVQSVKME